MTEDKLGEKPKTIDPDKVSLSELEKEYSKFTAKLDTFFIKKALEDKSFLEVLKERSIDPPSDENLTKEEKEKTQKNLSNIIDRKEKIIAKFGQEKGEKLYQDALKGMYRKAEKRLSDPDTNKAYLEEVKKKILESPIKKAQQFSVGATGNLEQNLMTAYAKAHEVSQANVLWNGDVSDILSFPKQPKTKSKMHVA